MESLTKAALTGKVTVWLTRERLSASTMAEQWESVYFPGFWGKIKMLYFPVFKEKKGRYLGRYHHGRAVGQCVLSWGKEENLG